MDIYANLNKAKMLKSKDPAEIEKSINTFCAWPKKINLNSTTTLIFYSAAELALDIPDTAAAISFFKRSVFYNPANVSCKKQIVS